MTVSVAALLAVLALGALLVPAIAPRLGLPEAVGQIFFGIGLGVVGLHPHGAAEEVLHVLAELGFILLMFGAGMEIDFEAIRRGGPRELLRGAGVAVGVLLASIGVTVAFGMPFFYAVVLSATSVGLGVVVLRETGQLQGPLGQTILLVGSIGEFLTLVLMTVLAVAARVGLSAEMVVELGRLAVLGVAGALFLRFLLAWTWWHPGPFGRLFTQHDPSELGVRAAILVCLTFVLLAAVLEIDPVLGAFLAGAVCRVVFKDLSQIEGKMSALSSGFFIPIFFVFVGLEFDLSQLSVSGFRTALLLGAGVMATRLLPSAMLMGNLEIGPREATGVALLLAAPLTLLVAIARLGADLEIIDMQESSDLVLLAILLSVVNPVLFKALFRRARA